MDSNRFITMFNMWQNQTKIKETEKNTIDNIPNDIGKNTKNILI